MVVLVAVLGFWHSHYYVTGALVAILAAIAAFAGGSGLSRWLMSIATVAGVTMVVAEATPPAEAGTSWEYVYILVSWGAQIIAIFCALASALSTRSATRKSAGFSDG